jgi:transporter family-2 protein
MSALLPMIAAAFLAGVLVSVSRSLNGRLGLSTSPLRASFWNHAVGAAVLTLIALPTTDLIPADTGEAPWWAWAGGPVGVVFIALGAVAVARLGASLTAMLVIAGNMISGAALDWLRGTGGDMLATLSGVALILAGIWLANAPGQPRTR